MCVCSVSDSREAKALLMNTKWLWEVNKQTPAAAAATTSHHISDQPICTAACIHTNALTNIALKKANDVFIRLKVEETEIK